MRFTPMTEEEAKLICKWKYEKPYNFYNLSEESLAEFLNGSFTIVTDKEQLIGYFCFGESAQVPGGKTIGLYDNKSLIDIGLAMNPILTGQGLGESFLKEGILYTISYFQPEGLRLSVATFNKRAITVYERVGFVKRASFMNKTTEFQIMEHNLNHM